jgi:hypothetical protein
LPSGLRSTSTIMNISNKRDLRFAYSKALPLWGHSRGIDTAPAVAACPLRLQLLPNLCWAAN